MKAVLATLWFATMVAAPSAAIVQEGAESHDGPVMEISPESHDFGRVEQNQKLLHEFEIENVGSEDLVIGRISTSCGCTAALTSEKVVEPGEKTVLEVTLETRKYKGAIQRSVSISSNDRRRVRTVRITAYVEEPK